MLPKLISKRNNIDVLNNFMGLNKNYRIAEAEFSEMKNITNDYFPTIANRNKRGIITQFINPKGFLGGQYLAYVDDNKLYYNDNFITALAATDNERQLVIMGAYLVVFPDGLIYNTYTEEISYIENKVITTTKPTFTLSKMDGSKFTSSNTITSSVEPNDKTKYWIDTSADTVVVKMYSNNTSSWVSVGTTYVKIESAGIGVGFKAYDAARIEGVDETNAIYNGWNFNDVNIIYDAGEDYIIVAGIINQTFTNSKNITVTRELPKLDYVCELENRIWGCSSDKHEIYACKLGDPTNWYCYAGLDSDSYAVTVGSEDIFTGAIAYSGYVFFFKENGYHKLYGSKPSNYEMVWKGCRGVQRGCEKSLVIVNEVLMYKARDAVCIFDGTVSKVSEKLGYESYYGAIAGAYRDKYYVSMRDADYNFHLFVYDTTKGTWVIEDDMELKYAANANGGLYLVDKNNTMYVVNNEKIYTKNYPSALIYPLSTLFSGNSVAGTVEDDFNWSLTSGDIGEDTPYHKYIKRLDIRVWLDISAYMKIEIMYDSSEEWVKVMEYYATRKRSYELPIVVQRCDHLNIRISGHGNFRLYSIAKVTEQGSDVEGGTS